jgi:hypothetical protein
MCYAARLALFVLVACPAVARAQEALAELPDSVALRVVAFYNSALTTRLAGGESRVAEGARLSGPVAVLGGPFTVAGRVEGDLVVINGDLLLEAGAEITGAVTVVGGSISGTNLATIGGAVLHYREPLRFRHDAGELVYVPASIEPELSAGREFAFGRTDFLIAARRDYNRVEGLPISIGPRVRIGKSNPTLLEAFAIYRSSAGLRIDPDQLGYAFRAEQFLGGGQTARLGLRIYSDITPIEAQGISDRENALSTFVLHRDFRDAYEREGWSAYLRFARSGWPHDLTFEYRDERHRSVASGSPWSLFDNADPWRAQPVVAEGKMRSISARLSYDTRNEVIDPATGWQVLAEVEQGTGGRLEQPALTSPGSDSVIVDPVRARDRFTSASIDIRRYVRTGPGSRLGVRVFGAGSADGNALPPQRQRALGGEGELPGYRLYEFDCGARSRQGALRGDPSFPWYGCDRVALVQLEYQAAFPWLSRQAESLGRSLNIEHSVRWVVFFDAGRAWNEPDAAGLRGRGQGDFSADAGLGLRLGGLGLYWAVPLSSSGQGLNFFVRLGRRL